MESKFKEIRNDHVDDKGVVHLDGYRTDDDNEEGIGIGYVINGEVYYRDPEFQFDPYVKEIVQETIKMQTEGKQKVIDALIEQIKSDANDGDVTVLDEILQQVPKDFLINSLPEEEWIKYL